MVLIMQDPFDYSMAFPPPGPKTVREEEEFGPLRSVASASASVQEGFGASEQSLYPRVPGVRTQLPQHEQQQTVRAG